MGWSGVEWGGVEWGGVWWGGGGDWTLASNQAEREEKQRQRAEAVRQMSRDFAEKRGPWG